MARGGARPGAGKKKGTLWPSTILKQKARERLTQLVYAQLEAMVEAQFDNAKGLKHFFLRDPKTKQFIRIDDPVKIELALNCGEEGSYYWIHTKDPSTQAFTALTDRAFDKPAEHVEMTGADGGPLEVKWQT